MPAIRYLCHLQQPTGYGRAALELATALDRAKVELEVKTIGPRDSDWSPKALSESLRPLENPDAIIVHTLPGDCHRVLELEGLRRGAGPKLVAQTTWEAITAPAALLEPLFANFDQVWVPSLANRTAFGGGSRRGLHIIPHTFDEEFELPQHGQADDDRFRFYYVGAWTCRKNPGSLIRAFAHAFKPGSRAELVIHSPGCPMEAFVAALAATGLQQDELPTITLSNKYIGADSLAKLHADADCFVTASRGEAWNLPAFDAMRSGRHVITQYGLGSDDFLADTSAYLVDGFEAPAQMDVAVSSSSDGAVTVKRVGAQGLTSRSLWLEPNLSSLSDAMQDAFAASRRNIHIRYDVAERFGYAAVAKQVLNVLEQP